MTDYLKEHFTIHDFDFLDLLKSLDPNPADRPLIEEEIRSAVAAILENAMRPTGLKNLASKIAVSDFRVSVCMGCFHLYVCSLRETDFTE